jgi:hypothetical protein
MQVVDFRTHAHDPLCCDDHRKDQEQEHEQEWKSRSLTFEDDVTASGDGRSYTCVFRNQSTNFGSPAPSGVAGL